VGPERCHEQNANTAHEARREMSDCSRSRNPGNAYIGLLISTFHGKDINMVLVGSLKKIQKIVRTRRKGLGTY
jgi:hypothetical protein